MVAIKRQHFLTTQVPSEITQFSPIFRGRNSCAISRYNCAGSTGRYCLSVTLTRYIIQSNAVVIRYLKKLDCTYLYSFYLLFKQKDHHCKMSKLASLNTILSYFELLMRFSFSDAYRPFSYCLLSEYIFKIMCI